MPRSSKLVVVVSHDKKIRDRFDYTCELRDGRLVAQTPEPAPA